QVEDVDAVARGEDVGPHLWVPAAGLMPEMDTRLQQLLQGHLSHVSIASLFHFRPVLALNQGQEHCPGRANSAFAFSSGWLREYTQGPEVESEAAREPPRAAACGRDRLEGGVDVDVSGRPGGELNDAVRGEEMVLVDPAARHVPLDCGVRPRTQLDDSRRRCWSADARPGGEKDAVAGGRQG